jgi:hypothetical protein
MTVIENGIAAANTPLIYAKDYGATGDSVTDDYAAIQAALTFAKATVVTGAAGGTVVLGRGIFRSSAQIVVPARCRLVGQGPLATAIQAHSSFPTSTAIVRLGQSTDDAPECTTLEQVRLLLNDIATSTGVYSNGVNELSGVFDCIIQGYTNYGIWFELTSGDPPANCSVERVNCLSSSVSGATAGVFISTMAGEGLIKNVSVVNAAGPGGPLTAAGIRTGTTGSMTMLGIHAESCTDGIDVTGSNSAGTIIGFSGSSSNTNCITLRSGTGNWVAISTENKGETHTIVDVANSVTLNGNVPYYQQGATITDDSIVAASEVFPAGDMRPVDHGYKFWNFDPMFSNGNGTVLTSQTLHVTRINTPGASRACTEVDLACTVVGSGLTSGQNLVNVYNGATGALLSASADQTTSFGSGTGIKTVTGLSFNTPADSYIYVVVMSNGTTPISLLRGSTGFAGVTNANITVAGQRRAATNLTGQTVMPSPLVTSSNVAAVTEIWAAIK